MRYWRFVFVALITFGGCREYVDSELVYEPDGSEVIRFSADSLVNYTLNGRVFTSSDSLGSPLFIATSERRIYVGDNKATQSLLVFNRNTGEFIMSAGERGQGPREINYLWAMDFKPGIDPSLRSLGRGPPGTARGAWRQGSSPDRPGQNPGGNLLRYCALKAPLSCLSCAPLRLLASGPFFLAFRHLGELFSVSVCSGKVSRSCSSPNSTDFRMMALLLRCRFSAIRSICCQSGCGRRVAATLIFCADFISLAPPGGLIVLGFAS